MPAVISRPLPAKSARPLTQLFVAVPPSATSPEAADSATVPPAWRSRSPRPSRASRIGCVENTRPFTTSPLTAVGSPGGTVKAIWLATTSLVRIDEVAAVSAPSLARSEKLPPSTVPVSESPENEARPPDQAAASVPASATSPVCTASVAVPPCSTSTLPCASRASSNGCVANTRPFTTSPLVAVGSSGRAAKAICEATTSMVTRSSSLAAMVDPLSPSLVRM